MAEVLELRPELHVVVDLSVLHRPEATALIGKGLVATVEVDDREPRVDHAEPAVEVEPGAVWTTVAKLARHREEYRRLSLAVGARVDAGKAAHSPHL